MSQSSRNNVALKADMKVGENGSNHMYSMILDELLGSMEMACYGQWDYHATGHSITVLDRDCIMIIGGSTQGILMYATISQSDIVSPIAWIKCKGSCKKWLHWFCVGITREPREFVCVYCRQIIKYVIHNVRPCNSPTCPMLKSITCISLAS